MAVDVSGTIKGLDLLNVRIDAAVKQTVADVLHMFQAAGMEKAPVGLYPENSTNAAGDLARSIEVTGPDGSDGSYSGLVGPTTVYGRQRELGGEIFGFEPLLRFRIYEDIVYTERVYQRPEPYMLPAEEENWVNVYPIAESRIAEAIVSG